MISAWDVYLVMQLDSIGSFLTVVCGFSTFLFLCLSVLHVFAGAYKDEDNEAAKCHAVTRPAVYLLFLMAFGWTVGVLLPSSKTAAAMIILPAITSDNAVEAMKPEAKELYNLAKEAMRSLVEQPKSKEVEK